MLIHDLSSNLILEAFMGKYMTPFIEQSQLSFIEAPKIDATYSDMQNILPVSPSMEFETSAWNYE